MKIYKFVLQTINIYIQEYSIFEIRLQILVIYKQIKNK